MIYASIGVAILVTGALATPSQAQPAQARAPAPIVYFDIAGPSQAGQLEFYEKVFGWIAGPGGTISVPVSGPHLGGTLRTDPAAKVIYLGVPDVSATLREVAANGGKIIAPRFEVKGVAVLALFTDPAGNGMGLVELTPDGKMKIP